jgi:hypothetical protein
MMYAGNDISHIIPIHQEARSELEGKTDLSLREVAGILRRAYRNQLAVVAEDFILSPLGIDLKKFLGEGNQLFPKETFEDMRRAIQQVTLQCDLLVFGFDRERNPHIFVVSDHGTSYSDVPGFAAIGTGSYSALSTLYFHAFKTRMTIPHALYHACEAKFTSESAQGVGHSTWVLVLEADGSVRALIEPQIDEIRDLWDRQGKPRLPKRAIAKVSELYSEAELLVHPLPKDERQPS